MAGLDAGNISSVTPPAPPAAPPPGTYTPPVGIDPNLAAFSKLLQGDQGNNGAISDYFSEASRLRGIGTGASDPAFAEYIRSQGANLSAEQKATTAQQAEFLGRRGMGDSSVALNTAARTGAAFDLKRDSLASSIGLMGLSRRDDAFASAMNAEGAGISLAAKPAELAISELAAQNAGKMPDAPGNGANAGINSWMPWLTNLTGGGGGVPTPNTNTVLCTLVYSKGDLPKRIYDADCAYGRTHASITTFRGYYLWAKPLSDWARHDARVYKAVRPFVQAWAHRMAHNMGVEAPPHWGGFAFQAVVQPVCFALGCGLSLRKRAKRWIAHLALVA